MREELEFMLRMRASLRGILPLDPAGVSARLAELDGAIEALASRLDGAPGEADPAEPVLRAA